MFRILTMIVKQLVIAKLLRCKVINMSNNKTRYVSKEFVKEFLVLSLLVTVILFLSLFNGFHIVGNIIITLLDCAKNTITNIDCFSKTLFELLIIISMLLWFMSQLSITIEKFDS